MDTTRFQKKKHLFFDLDHTIWDFDRNAAETLSELFVDYQFERLGIASSDLFIETYNRNNQRVWAMYHNGLIDKTELRRARFADTFTELGIDPASFPQAFEEDYLRICPHKTHLFPGAYETLAYLQERYTLHLISNGFKEAVETKLAKSNLKPYFHQVIISEVVGVHKPNPKIYDHSLAGAKGSKTDSIMIGDSLEADVRGAMNFGMDAIFFNPNALEKPADIPYSIQQLKELKEWF
ncbi:YjjG family noncanonical pyrimidine nucleotidase [Olivibacter sitiensis]|uniref:YjjG family noncanonical pyrimidine nucleotidase n=1 Tax=Olivibacter sitiensis TaxID=376470 RepID=UPI0004141738|nr:YjjG family noncanonical pyrimidine nucleotidase [Olivibacter sitiensis]